MIIPSDTVYRFITTKNICYKRFDCYKFLILMVYNRNTNVFVND